MNYKFKLVDGRDCTHAFAATRDRAYVMRDALERRLKRKVHVMHVTDDDLSDAFWTSLEQSLSTKQKNQILMMKEDV